MYAFMCIFYKNTQKIQIDVYVCSAPARHSDYRCTLPMSLPLSAPLAIADMLPSPLVVHTEGPL